MSNLDRFRLAVAIIVLVVWVGTVFASPNHDPPAGVQLIMTGVAGWLFAGPIVSSVSRRGKNGGHDAG